MIILVIVNAIVLCIVTWLEAYRKGYSDCFMNKANKPIQTLKKEREEEESDEERRTRMLFENIENYSGSGLGQKVI